MNIYKIKLHPLFYFVLITSLLTGYFKNIIIFTSIILVHELGHIITAYMFNWKIEKIIIMPFGGLTIFNTKINKSLIEEFFIAISGILFQIIFFIIFKKYLIKEYHYAILIFNLLPIYPLDGYKIINLLLYNIIPFKTSNLICLIFSLIVSLILIINYKNLAFYLIISCLIIKIIKELKNQKNIFNKFLLERYLYNFKYKKIKKIKGLKINKMMYNKKHHFIIKNKPILEQDILKKMFDNH